MVYNIDTERRDIMNIGEKIKTARLAKGMTQEELGKALGKQKAAIAKYEKGIVVNIKRSTLQKMADILGIAPSELIFDSYLEEEQKKNDIQADIILRMRSDSAFMSAVETLYKLDTEKLDSINQMLNTLFK
jgi:transcriptional regulator with XRE-family HTH domain